MSANLSQWWEPALRPDLSQGDILGSVPFAMPKWPVTYLKHTNLKGGASGWTDSNEPALSKIDQKTYVLAAVNSLAGLVISHDCEIDKASATRLLVAPVIPMSTLDEPTRRLVMEQRLFAMMALPAIPDSVDSYADLRLITPIPREAIAASQRVTSMTDTARTLLHARLAAFLLDRRM